mgnify:CR=1 FL=1
MQDWVFRLGNTLFMSYSVGVGGVVVPALGSVGGVVVPALGSVHLI